MRIRENGEDYFLIRRGKFRFKQADVVFALIVASKENVGLVVGSGKAEPKMGGSLVAQLTWNLDQCKQGGI